MRNGAEFNRTEPVYICHVCSQCGKPVVMHSEIRIHVEDGRAFADSSKLPEEAGAAAAAAINKIFAVYSCQGDKPLTKAHEHSSPRFNVSCDVMLYNVSARCPHCGRVEKWQGGPDVGELSAGAYPVFFDIEEEAKAWAIGKVLEQRKALNNSLNGTGQQITAELNGTAEKLRNSMAAIKYLSNLDNFGVLKEIQRNKAELNKRISELGMFKSKEKKELNAELDAQTAQENEYLQSIREERRKKGAEYHALSEKVEEVLCKIGKTKICAELWTNKVKPVQVQYETAEAFTFTSEDYYRTAKKICPDCGMHSPRIAFYCGSCGKKFE